MVKEAWESLKDNIKDRITNPFLGTFVVVWIAHNWKVVYSFFYFDKEWKLEKKIQFFKDFWSDKSFFWNLIWVAIVTLGILIITYIFLAISRYLANLFENVVVPNIQRISKGKIVTIETYQKVLDRVAILEGKVEEERKSKNQAISERDDFEKRFYEITYTSNAEKKDDKKVSEVDFKNQINHVDSTYGQKEVEEALMRIIKGHSFKRDSPGVINFLLKHGFVKLDSTSGDYVFYGFTTEGEKFRKQYFDHNP